MLVAVKMNYVPLLKFRVVITMSKVAFDRMEVKLKMFRTRKNFERISLRLIFVMQMLCLGVIVQTEAVDYKINLN